MGELVALDPQRTTVQVAESVVATVTLEGGAATITAPEPVTTTRRVRLGRVLKLQLPGRERLG